MNCLNNAFAENGNKLNPVLNIDYFDLCYAADNYPDNDFLHREPESEGPNGYYPKENLIKVTKKAPDLGFTRINFRVSANGRVVIPSNVKERQKRICIMVDGMRSLNAENN